MKIYDSRTTQKVALPNQPITIYNCGPTVYNEVHIGNIRPLLTFDFLFRYLKAIGVDVKYMHNITDVDDKIINRAQEEHTTEAAVSQKYTKAYFDVMKSLNVLKMDYLPKVTENIEGIIDYVNRLIKLDKAYIAKDGDVYFKIDAVKDTYGEISKQKINELLKGVRKENKSNKINPLDFVLWKNTDVGVNWKSPWNEHGRPGWHTECAYFINKNFGDNITIHGGGIDLKFPHHENENAQNIALTGKEMAQIWMHVGHVNVNNQKMSKSLNNFIYARELIDKYGNNTIRWFFLQTKFENPINYSESLMVEAQNSLEKLFRSINNILIQLILNDHPFTFDKNSHLIEAFKAYMEDDLNFPKVVSLIQSQVKDLNAIFKQKDYVKLNQQINDLIQEFNTLGIIYEPTFNREVNSLINNYKKALAKKDYAKSDAIRQELVNLKII